MALLQFSCPHCQGVFQVDDAMGGQTVACPHCQGHVQISGGEGRETEPPPQVASHASPPAVPPEPPQFPAPPSFPGQSVPASPPAPVSTPPPQQSAVPPRPTGPALPTRPGAEPMPLETMPAEPSNSARAKFEIACAKCAGIFRSNPAMIGQQVLCPFCGAKLVVPEGGGRAELAETVAPAAPLSTNRAILIDPNEKKQEEPADSISVQTEKPAAEKPTEEAKEAAKRPESSVFKPAEGEEIVDPELAVRDDQTRLVRVGDQMIEIRRLTPEERAARRFKRNIIMVVFGALVLGVTFFFLLRG